MKKFTTITVAAAIAVSLLAGCGSGKTAIKSGDLTVTQGDIKLIASLYAANGADYETAKEYAAEYFEDALVIYNAATAKNVELDESDNSQIIQSFASFKQSVAGSASEFKKMLKKYGANEELLKIANSQSVYYQKISDELNAEEPTDEEAKKYLKENYLRATHVLLMTGRDDGEDDEHVKQRAEDILAKAKNGEDFDKMVQDMSEDPGSKSAPKGYVFTAGDMVSEFEDAVRSINPGEYTMCQSSYGYHVIKRLPLDEKDADFNDLFEENKDTVKSALQVEKIKEAMKKIGEDAGVTVEKYDDVIAAIASPKPTAEPTEAPTDDVATEEAATE